MLRGVVVVLLGLALSGCKPGEEGHVKAIIGAVLVDGAGGPPVSNSVVVVAGGRIRGAGQTSNIPIPSDADTVNGGGRFLVPALIDICDSADPAGLLRPATAADARPQV